MSDTSCKVDITIPATVTYSYGMIYLTALLAIGLLSFYKIHQQIIKSKLSGIVNDSKKQLPDNPSLKHTSTVKSSSSMIEEDIKDDISIQINSEDNYDVMDGQKEIHTIDTNNSDDDITVVTKDEPNNGTEGTDTNQVLCKDIENKNKTK